MKSAHKWQHAIEDCDIHDKHRLREFRSKADIWIKSLEKDDQNSISSQILQMMWDDAAWRSLNRARFIARDREDIGTSSIVGSLLDRGYISGQVIAISRLLERGAARPQKQINSLRRLVDEISNSQHLITREIYICRDGLPYDHITARLTESNISQKNFIPTWLNSPLDFHQSLLLHEEFDRLSGVSPEQRSRDDLIANTLFERLSKTLEDAVFQDILELRHKSIAHAADEISRRSSKNLRGGISLDEIAKAHYLLLGVYQAISSNILYQSWLGSAVATPQYDQFEGLNKPIIDDDNFHELYDFWRDHCSERNDWLYKSYREIIPR